MKNQIGVAAAVGAVLLAAGWTGYVQAQRTNPSRQAWHYRIDVTSDRTQRVDIAAENQRILDTRAAERLGTCSGRQRLLLLQGAVVIA